MKIRAGHLPGFSLSSEGGHHPTKKPQVPSSGLNFPNSSIDLTQQKFILLNLTQPKKIPPMPIIIGHTFYFITHLKFLMFHEVRGIGKIIDELIFSGIKQKRNLTDSWNMTTHFNFHPEFSLLMV